MKPLSETVKLEPRRGVPLAVGPCRGGYAYCSVRESRGHGAYEVDGSAAKGLGRCPVGAARASRNQVMSRCPLRRQYAGAVPTEDNYAGAVPTEDNGYQHIA